ncbi:MAG: hypothetical protein JXB49_06005 [Bacteroidales bacterium]|nr:hypothetical protein [Bacteroidales bacterium]
MEKAIEFLRAIFLNTGGFLEIRYIDLSGNIKNKPDFVPIESIDKEIPNLFNQKDILKNYHVYFGVCPRPSDSGKEKDIKQANALWVDIDCKDAKEKEDRLNQLNSFPLTPSIVVDSGHGYHAYWLLDKPFQISSAEDRCHIKGIMKGLSETLPADHCFDLSRVLRLPGTYNLKDKDNPLLVKIISIHSGRRYSIQDFESYRVGVDEINNSNIELKDVEIPERFYGLLIRDERLKNTWEGKREDLKDKTRSGYDMSLADQLKNYGFTDCEISAILREAPSGKGKDASTAYLKHTIRKTQNIKKKSVSYSESKEKFNPRQYSENILIKYHLKYDKFKRFWIYDDKEGIWREDAEEQIKSILRKKILGNKDYKRYCVDEVVADLKDLTYSNKELIEPEPHLIPLNNGIYDLKGDQLLDYSHEYFFISKIPVDYNPKHKECLTVDSILTQMVGDNHVVTLKELIAYCLYRGYPYQKFFILYGDGANGKSTLIRILEKVLGRHNISSVSLTDFQNNRFAASRLFGKHANVGSEISYQILRDTSRLKQLTGEDSIECEKKFKDPFSYRNHAKLIFLTNQLPVTLDKSDALYRRIFLIEFPNKFVAGDNADPMIIDSITEDEVEGLLFQCIDILKGLISRDFIFSNHEDTRNVIEKYERLSNPLLAFLEDRTEKDLKSYIPISEFKSIFIEYLKENKQISWSSQQINRAMKEEGYIQTIIDNTRAWIGIKWK